MDQIYVDLIKKGLYTIDKEVQDMVAIYVALIIKGLYTIDRVPYTVKEDVKAMLIELELPELAEEQEQA